MIVEDQLGRSIQIAHWPPQRIVSLVPSQTELLYRLGLDAAVVGITKFCVRPPEWRDTKTIIGGTKTLNLEKIAALAPDLILGNKEENDRQQIEALSECFPVWMSDVITLPDAYDLMLRAGHLCGKAKESEALLADIKTSFSGFYAPKPALRAAYLIWRKPYMAAAADTYIHSMLGLAGFHNCFAHLGRYPQISAAALQAAEPNIILLSSEPFPFAEKHIRELQDLCPAAQVLLVDGEVFSWYGPRMLHAAAYFEGLYERAKRSTNVAD